MNTVNGKGSLGGAIGYINRVCNEFVKIQSEILNINSSGEKNDDTRGVGGAIGNAGGSSSTPISSIITSDITIVSRNTTKTTSDGEYDQGVMAGGAIGWCFMSVKKIEVSNINIDSNARGVGAVFGELAQSSIDKALVIGSITVSGSNFVTGTYQVGGVAGLVTYGNNLNKSTSNKNQIKFDRENEDEEDVKYNISNITLKATSVTAYMGGFAGMFGDYSLGKEQQGKEGETPYKIYTPISFSKPVNISNLQFDSPNSNYIGGFAGIIHLNELGNSDVFAPKINIDGITIQGNQYIGGFAGSLNSSGCVVSPEVSINNANITASSDVGGGIGEVKNSVLGGKFVSNGVTLSGSDIIGGVFGKIIGGAVNAELTSSDVTIDALGESVGGGIGYISSSNINERLTIKGSNITSNGDNVGGAIGYAYSTNVKKSIEVSSTSVSSQGNNVGGAIGYAYSPSGGNYISGDISVKDSSGGTSGSTPPPTYFVTGRNYVGGVVGNLDSYNVSSQLTNKNINVGESSTSNYVGGLIGKSDSSQVSGALSVNFSTNAFTILGNNYVGGAIGTIDSGTLQQRIQISGRESTISGNNFVGGLVGGGGASIQLTDSSRLQGLTIKGSNYVGGIVGVLSGTTLRVYGAFAFGASSAADTKNRITIEAQGGYALGGLVGYAMNSSIFGCPEVFDSGNYDVASRTKKKL